MISRRLIAVVLSLAGLADAAYLSAVHVSQGQVPLICSASGLVDCAQVTSSPESRVGPVPVAYLGILWFLAMLAIVLAPTVPRAARAAQWPDLLQLGWAVAGVLFVLYLVYSELLLIGAICLWCTVVHALVFLLFLLSVEGYVNRPSANEEMEPASAPRFAPPSTPRTRPPRSARKARQSGSPPRPGRDVQ